MTDDQQQNAAYAAFREFRVKLTDLLPDKLRIKLAQALSQANILPEGWGGSSGELVLAVSQKIKYYPNVYRDFVIVLEKHDNGYFGCLIHEMKEACPLLFGACFSGEPTTSRFSRTRATPGHGPRMGHFSYPHDLASLAATENLPGAVPHVTGDVHYHLHTSNPQHQANTATPTEFTDSARSWTSPTPKTKQERMQCRIEELETEMKELKLKLMQKVEEQKSNIDQPWGQRVHVAEERTSRLKKEAVGLKVHPSEAGNSHTEIEELEKDEEMLRRTSLEMHEELDKKNKQLLENIDNLRRGFDHQLDNERQRCQELEEKCKQLALSNDEQLSQLKREHEERIARLNEEWKQKVDEQDLRASRLEEECTQLNSNISEMERTFAKKEEQLRVFIQEQKQEKRKLEDEKKILRQTSEEMCNDIERHKQQLQEVEEKTEILLSFKEKHDQVQQMLDVRNHSYLELEEECQELKLVKEEHLRALQVQEAELQRQAGEVNRLEEEYDELLARMNQLSLENKAEVLELRNNYQEKCKECESATLGSQRTEFYENKLKESMEEERKYMEYLKQEREQARKRDRQISELKAEVHMLRKELEANKKDLEKSRSALLQKELAENEFADERDEMEKEREALEEIVAQLKEELASVRMSTPKTSSDYINRTRQETTPFSSPMSPLLSTTPPSSRGSNVSDFPGPFQPPSTMSPFSPNPPNIPPDKSLPVFPTATPSSPKTHQETRGSTTLAAGEERSSREGNASASLSEASSQVNEFPMRISLSLFYEMETRYEQSSYDRKVALVEQAKVLGMDAPDELDIDTLETRVRHAFEKAEKSEKQSKIDQMFAIQLLKQEERGHLPHDDALTRLGDSTTSEHRQPRQPFPQEDSSSTLASSFARTEHIRSPAATPRSVGIDNEQPSLRQDVNIGPNKCPMCYKPKADFNSHDMFEEHCFYCGGNSS